MNAIADSKEYDQYIWSVIEAKLPDDICDKIARNVHRRFFNDALQDILRSKKCNTCGDEYAVIAFNPDGDSRYIFYNNRNVRWALMTTKVCSPCMNDIDFGERWYRKCDECDYEPTDEEMQFYYPVGFPEDTDWSQFPEEELVPCWQYNGWHARGWLCKGCLGDAVYYDNKD